MNLTKFAYSKKFNNGPVLVSFVCFFLNKLLAAYELGRFTCLAFNAFPNALLVSCFPKHLDLV